MIVTIIMVARWRWGSRTGWIREKEEEEEKPCFVPGFHCSSAEFCFFYCCVEFVFPSRISVVGEGRFSVVSPSQCFLLFFPLSVSVPVCHVH